MTNVWVTYVQPVGNILTGSHKKKSYFLYIISVKKIPTGKSLIDDKLFRLIIIDSLYPCAYIRVLSNDLIEQPVLFQFNNRSNKFKFGSF